MSKVLAAVGGTGQEIALACLRLCHMAGLEIPRVFVFDSDSDDHRPEQRTRKHARKPSKDWASSLRCMRDETP